MRGVGTPRAPDAERSDVFEIGVGWTGLDNDFEVVLFYDPAISDMLTELDRSELHIADGNGVGVLGATSSVPYQLQQRGPCKVAYLDFEGHPTRPVP